ncbi:MAG: diaminopimelate epimerase [Lactobacillales bacterium]|jgi:diaminopimelate epimerase|nr:diaminopimelate epimerase [Lactobacillales bacterium]
MKLLKVHGSMNSFFILDEKPGKLTPAQLETLRTSLCNGEGIYDCDGILLVSEADNSKAVARMTVVNKDGSIASMCGNGLRTVARYLSEETGLDEFYAETPKALLLCKKEEDLADGVPAFSVEISPISFDLASLPMDYRFEGTRFINQEMPELSHDLTYSALSVPNPHLISFTTLDDIHDTEFEKVASYVNSDEDTIFPDGVNVTYAAELGPNKIFAKTYERGVGFTNACGTAMSATSLIYTLLFGEESTAVVEVHNPGGMVKVAVDADLPALRLIGNATFTHEIKFEDLFDLATYKTTETNEQIAYDKFIESLKND